MADTWISVPIDTDEQALYDDAVATLRALKPGWEPAEGSLDTWILRAAARLASELRDVAADVPAAILRTYGREVFQLPALEPARATVATSWTAIDNAGHTIPAGTQFTLRDAAGALWAFRTQAEATITAGLTSVSGVLAEAVLPGAASSGLAGTPELIDALAWIAGVALDEPATSGGSDGETDSEYLSRLSRLLQIQSDVPILPEDFETLALTVTGVGRALAVDGYDPDDDTTGNERTIAVFVTDPAGANCSGGVRAAVAALLESRREANFVVKAASPTRTTINVTFTAKALAGYDTATVEAAAESAVAEYLSPALWGAQVLQGDAPWREMTHVRFLEIASVINAVEGVNYITALTVNGGAADIALHSPAGLPAAGTIAGTIT